MLTPSQVRDALDRAERRFVDACATTDEQWQYRPSGGGDRSWTISQIIEHVTGANRGIRKLLEGSVATSPRNGQLPDFEDEDLPYIFYGGGGGQPPGLSEPQGAAGRDDSIAEFRASMRSIVDWHDSTDVELRECALVHPAFGLFDGVQWLLFVAVHTQQHRGQILDVKIAADKVTSAASTG